MTNKTTMRKTEWTFSQAEIVCYYTKVKVCILILSKKLSEEIKSSVETMIECDLVNTPVPPVLNVLNCCRISIKSECYENIFEFSLNILDKNRRVKSKCSDAHIIHCMYECTNFLTNYRIKLILIHRERINEVVESYVTLSTFLYIISKLI